MEVSIDVVEKTVVVEEEVVVLTLTRREAVALRTLAHLHENGVYSYWATEGGSHFGCALFGEKLRNAGIRSDGDLMRAVEMYEQGSGFDNAVAHLPFGKGNV